MKINKLTERIDFRINKCSVVNELFMKSTNY